MKGSASSARAKLAVHKRLELLLTSHRVLLFMKGSRAFPQCGFSAKAVDLLDACDAEYSTIDVLGDSELRQGIKTYSDWPTFPQLYVNGELVGGCDVLAAMSESGALKALVSLAESTQSELG